jgi:hypothetical protein
LFMTEPLSPFPGPYSLSEATGILRAA